MPIQKTKEIKYLTTITIIQKITLQDHIPQITITITQVVQTILAGHHTVVGVVQGPREVPDHLLVVEETKVI